MSVCPLTLTPRAKEEIQALGGSLSISLIEGGCCGTSYCFSLHQQPSQIVLHADELTLYITPDALNMLSGAKLDYGARLKPPRFRVLDNPNASLRCACNRSFGQPFPGKSTPQCRAYCPMPWHQEVQNDEP